MRTVNLYPSVKELESFVDWTGLEKITSPYFNMFMLKKLALSGIFIVQVHYQNIEGTLSKNDLYLGNYHWVMDKVQNYVGSGNKVLTPFVVSVSNDSDCDNITKKFVVHNIAAFLTEAAANYLSSIVGTNSIRPAFGYPMCPIHSYKKDVLDLLEVNEYYKLTSTYGLIPETSICGVIIPK